MTGSSLISTEALATRLADPSLRIADASWYLPQAGRNPRAEYESAHIPGAVFFDIDVISDHETDLPHIDAKIRGGHARALHCVAQCGRC